MYFRVFVFLYFMIGCSVKQPSLNEQQKSIQTLARMVIALNPQVDRQEAYHLAKNSILYSQQLAKQYDAFSSPWINNALVNFRIKERGLCHQWTEDLLRFLRQQNYNTLELHSVSANIGYLNEHNALAVSAKGAGYDRSILLDAWRASGKLYFIKIKEDPNYSWTERQGLYGDLK